MARTENMPEWAGKRKTRPNVWRTPLLLLVDDMFGFIGYEKERKKEKVDKFELVAGQNGAPCSCTESEMARCQLEGVFGLACLMKQGLQTKIEKSDAEI